MSRNELHKTMHKMSTSPKLYMYVLARIFIRINPKKFLLFISTQVTGRAVGTCGVGGSSERMR